MIKAGDVILVKNRGLFGYVIRKATHSPYDHIGIFSSARDIIEATPKGVFKTNIDKYVNHNCIVWRLKREYNLNNGVAVVFAEKEIGESYDFLQIFRILFKFIFKTKRNDGNSRWTCSELVAEAYNAGGVKVKDINLDYATPGTFWRSGLFEAVA